MVRGEATAVVPLVNEVPPSQRARSRPRRSAPQSLGPAPCSVLGSRESEELLIEAREAAAARGPMLAGRSRLASRTWLRHSQRVTEARLELRSALAAFESAWVNPWSERARIALRAAGGTVTSPRSDADELTAQERQIAALAFWALQPRDRRPALPVAPHRQHASLPRIPQARDHLSRSAARRGGQPRRRRSRANRRPGLNKPSELTIRPLPGCRPSRRVVRS